MAEIITYGSNALKIKNSTDLNGLYQRWLSYIDRPKSAKTYQNGIRAFMDYLAENGITQPTRTDVIAWRDYLTTKYKATTVQTYLAGVKPFFSWLADEGLYKDIAKNVHGMKLDRQHKKGYLSESDSASVLGSIDRTTLKGKRDYAMLCVMITAGLRTIEVIRANVKDFVVIGGQQALKLYGKGKDDASAYVKIAPPVERAIKDYLKERNAKDDEPLFTSTANSNNGERMTTRSIRRIVKDVLNGAGYDSDNLTAHSLRHTAGTLALKGGSSVEQVQQMLRHSNISTTMIYVNDIRRESNNSELNVARAIFG